jgi:hypothetical protein
VSGEATPLRVAVFDPNSPILENIVPGVPWQSVGRLTLSYEDELRNTYTSSWTVPAQ